MTREQKLEAALKNLMDHVADRVAIRRMVWDEAVAAIATPSYCLHLTADMAAQCRRCTPDQVPESMTDLMVAPESIDAFMQANPLPSAPWSPPPVEDRPEGFRCQGRINSNEHEGGVWISMLWENGYWWAYCLHCEDYMQTAEPTAFAPLPQAHGLAPAESKDGDLT